jgi:hypothetical protein
MKGTRFVTAVACRLVLLVAASVVLARRTLFGSTRTAAELSSTPTISAGQWPDNPGLRAEFSFPDNVIAGGSR